MREQHVEILKKLNDDFRTGEINPIQLIITPGIHRYSSCDMDQILRRVKELTDFTCDTDISKEHAFGIFNFKGDNIVFLIEYFDISMTEFSSDPTNKSSTTRIMTVKLETEK